MDLYKHRTIFQLQYRQFSDCHRKQYRESNILDNIQFFDEFIENNKIKVVSERQQNEEPHYEKEYTLSLKNENDNRYFCLDI